MMVKYDEKIKKYNKEIIKMTNGTFQVTAKVPVELDHLTPKSLKNFWEMPPNFQRLFRLAKLLQGKAGDFVFQSSNGTQQIKVYEPEKYQNDHNTPLRMRARTIVSLASKEPKEKRKDKMRELYRNYPYYLNKKEPVNLKLRNFYFDKECRIGELLKIYRKNETGDELIGILEYKQKKEIKLQWNEVDNAEMYYAVNERTGTNSNILKVFWE